MVIYNTDFCYKPSYDRGVGKIPTECPAGKVNHAGLCYDDCISGFSDHGTLTCSRDCPSGYTDMGLTCHFNGDASYSPVHWNSCKYKKLGICIGGLVEDDCRAGYHKILSVCWIDVPAGFSGSSLDPIKDGTYSRAGSLPSDCVSTLVKDAGLCYALPKSGYTCSLTICLKDCASGTSNCGPLACATGTFACASSIVDMVIAPLAVILNVMTAGTAGNALKDVDDAAKAVTAASKLYKAASALEKVGYAQALEATILALVAQVTSAMSAAKSNLKSVTNDAIATAVANKYTVGSANYNSIAKRWTQIYIMASVASFVTALSDIAISVADPTGIIGLIQAYNKPQCQQHTTIP